MSTRTELPWDKIQAEIEDAVRNGFPNLKYIKTRHIAQHIQACSTLYPTASEGVPKKISCRVTVALAKDSLETGWKMWNHGKAHTRGSPVWIVLWVVE